METTTYEVEEQEFKKVLRPGVRSGECYVCGGQLEMYLVMWVGQTGGECVCAPCGEQFFL